jgi:hypothetical protein
MRRNTLFAAVVAATLGAADAEAQKAPTKEFGVDVVLSSTGFDGGESRVTRFNAPFDVRIGFLNDSPLSIEPRFAFSWAANENQSLLTFTPSLNMLFRISNGVGVNKHMGGYLALGALMDLERYSFEGTLSSEDDTATQFGVTLGAGTRIEWGTAAFRPELFFAKRIEKNDAPGSNTFGVRFGISFFQ